MCWLKRPFKKSEMSICWKVIELKVHSVIGQVVSLVQEAFEITKLNSSILVYNSWSHV